MLPYLEENTQLLIDDVDVWWRSWQVRPDSKEGKDCGVRGEPGVDMREMMGSGEQAPGQEWVQSLMHSEV